MTMQRSSKRMSKFILGFLFAIGALIALPAAALTTSTASSMFEANAAAIGSVLDPRDFNSILGGGNFSSVGVTAVTLMPSSTAPAGSPSIAISSLSAGYAHYAAYGGYGVTLFQSVDDFNLNTVRIDVSGAGTSALGFDYGSTIFSGSDLTVTITGALGSLGTETIALADGTSTARFFGLVSTTPITRIEIAANVVGQARELNVFNLSVGTVAAVPEPSLGLMFGIGLALIGAVARRKTR
jgi:hypothetical protein